MQPGDNSTFLSLKSTPDFLHIAVLLKIIEHVYIRGIHFILYLCYITQHVSLYKHSFHCKIITFGPRGGEV